LAKRRTVAGIKRTGGHLKNWLKKQQTGLAGIFTQPVNRLSTDYTKLSTNKIKKQAVFWRNVWKV
jgi:hypothetical protein